MPTLTVIALLLPLAASASCLQACDWYVVKDNGALATRPAYTLVDGVLVKSKERAPVGATCDTMRPTKPSKQRNKDLYASYDSTGTVALCSKR